MLDNLQVLQSDVKDILASDDNWLKSGFCLPRVVHRAAHGDVTGTSGVGRIVHPGTSNPNTMGTCS